MTKTTSSVFHLEREQLVKRPVDAVFEFFSEVNNLEAITPPWLQFRVCGSSTPRIEGGSMIDYRLRIHGLPIRWRSHISMWNPPFGFTDEQVSGPYKLWVHRHTFVETDEGVLVRDHVKYSVPGGRLIHWLFVERDLRQIFDYRAQSLARIFPSD